MIGMRSHGKKRHSSASLLGAFCLAACATQSHGPTWVADAGADVIVSDASTSDAVADAPSVVDAHVDAPGTVDAKADAPSIVDAKVDAPGPWTPKNLTGLALWLDGSVGVTAGTDSKVSKWADQSGNGNDATQQNANSQPLLSGKVNNRDCLYYSQTGTPVELSVPSPANASMAGDFTVMLVFLTELASTNASELFRSEASSTTNTSISVSPPTLMASFIASGSGKFAQAPQPIFDDKKAHVVGMRKSATKLEVFADGASASVTNPPVGNPSGKFVIGAQIKGQLCEVVLATATVDQTSVDQLTAYLKARYAVP